MMRGRIVLLLWLLAGSPLSVLAEWQVGAYFGGTHTQTTSLLIEQPGLATRLHLRNVDFTGRSLDTPLYYGFRGGYFFARHLGLEVEFIHLKVFSRVERMVSVEGILLGVPIATRLPMNAIVGRFDISHGVNLLLGNVIFRQDFLPASGKKLGRVVLTARVGVGGTIPHPESEILGAGEQHYEAGRPAVQVAGGVEFQLWHGFYWLSEYKYTRTHQHVRIVDGTAETLLRTHHGVAGFAYHF